jgi:hypothetical protein
MLCASWHSAISTTWNRQPQAPLEAKLKKAAAGGDTTQVSIALADGANGGTGRVPSEVKSMFILLGKSPHQRRQLAPWNLADLF